MVIDDDAELYRKHADELIRFASALVGPSGAEDVLATAMVHTLSAPSWPSVVNKRAYLYRSVMNEATRVRRSTERRLRREMRAATAASYEPDHIDAEVIAALLVLTSRQRAAVFLTYWADLSPAETAAAIGVSLRTIERELAAARRHLERTLK